MSVPPSRVSQPGRKVSTRVLLPAVTSEPLLLSLSGSSRQWKSSTRQRSVLNSSKTVRPLLVKTITTISFEGAASSEPVLISQVGCVIFNCTQELFSYITVWEVCGQAKCHHFANIKAEEKQSSVPVSFERSLCCKLHSQFNFGIL